MYSYIAEQIYGLPVEFNWLVVDNYLNVNLRQATELDVSIGSSGIKKINNTYYCDDKKIRFDNIEPLGGFIDAINIYNQAKSLGLPEWDYNIKRFHAKSHTKGISIWEE